MKRFDPAQTPTIGKRKRRRRRRLLDSNRPLPQRISIAVYRRAIGWIGYTTPGAAVWHQSGRPRWKSRRISGRVLVGYVGVGGLRRVHRSGCTVECRGPVYRPLWPIARRVCGTGWKTIGCVVRRTRRHVRRISVFVPKLNMSGRDIDASGRHVDGLHLACRNL